MAKPEKRILVGGLFQRTEGKDEKVVTYKRGDVVEVTAEEIAAFPGKFAGQAVGDSVVAPDVTALQAQLDTLTRESAEKDATIKDLEAKVKAAEEAAKTPAK